MPDLPCSRRLPRPVRSASEARPLPLPGACRSLPQEVRPGGHLPSPTSLRSLLALALLGLSWRPALASDGPVDLSVGPGSSLSYVLVHKFHEVVGTSTVVEGRARLLPGGGVQVMVRAAVDSFDSGNGNRDAHMQEVTEAARFPLVTFKAAGALTPPATYPATVALELAGEVGFHGVSRAVKVPVTVTFTSPKEASAEGTLTLSLEAHGVERPSLLFVKVDDALVVKARLRLEAAP